jgi:hypothetical protein
MPRTKYSDDELRQALDERDGNASAVARDLSLNLRSLLRRLQRKNIIATAVVETTDDALPNTTTVDPSKQRYVITSVVNNSPLNVRFLAQLEEFTKENDAQLLCVPQRYKNPSAMHTAEGCVWPEGLPYISHDAVLSERVVLAGSAKPQATSPRPISGYEGYGRGRSVVIGHSRIQLASVPRLLPDPAVFTLTTGSLSEAQYSDTKMGSLGMFHHVNAALLIEVDRTNNRMWFRHLHFNKVGEKLLDPLKDIDTLVLGDLHVGHGKRTLDPLNWSAVNALSFDQVVVHDVIDGYSISHHHDNDPFLRMAKRRDNTDCLLTELRSVSEALAPWLDRLKIVQSNHDEHIDRWLNSGKGHNDPVNMHLYHWLCLQKTEAIFYKSTVQTYTALQHYLETYGGFRLDNFVNRNTQFKVHGIELGQHGDRGANGSRKLNAKVRDKTIFGHRHTPSIEDGAMCVGTSSVLDLGYNKGYSGWAHVHAVITHSGSATLFNTEGGTACLTV